MIDNLEKFSAKRSMDTTLVCGPAKSYICPEPLGVVLVISSWNFPTYVAIPPVACAIAAGNSVILKPSEMAPKCSGVLKKLFHMYLDQRFYRCIEG